MSGGAESSILPSLPSNISALTAPKSRDIARNDGESADFARVLNSQSGASPPTPKRTPSAARVEPQNSQRGKALPPDAASSAAQAAITLEESGASLQELENLLTGLEL